MVDNTEPDFIEHQKHLRVTHFALVTTCIALLIVSTLEKPAIYQTALVQANSIQSYFAAGNKISVTSNAIKALKSGAAGADFWVPTPMNIEVEWTSRKWGRKIINLGALPPAISHDIPLVYGRGKPFKNDSGYYPIFIPNDDVIDTYFLATYQGKNYPYDDLIGGQPSFLGKFRRQWNLLSKFEALRIINKVHREKARIFVTLANKNERPLGEFSVTKLDFHNNKLQGPFDNSKLEKLRSRLRSRLEMGSVGALMQNRYFVYSADGLLKAISAAADELQRRPQIWFNQIPKLEATTITAADYMLASLHKYNEVGLGKDGKQLTVLNAVFVVVIPVEVLTIPVPGRRYLAEALNKSYVELTGVSAISRPLRGDGTFEEEFRELQSIAGEVPSLRFTELIKFLERQAQIEGRNISLFGVQAPANLISTWGVPLIAVILAYFLVHLREFVTRLGQNTVPEFPWIGNYSHRFPRGLFIASTIVMPSGAALILASQLWSTGLKFMELFFSVSSFIAVIILCIDLLQIILRRLWKIDLAKFRTK